MSELLCVVGASGFLGGRTLQNSKGRRRALQHRRVVHASGAVEIVCGDASDPAAMARLLEPGATVLNFVHGGTTTSERMAEVLGQACAHQGTRRLVHVSTCSVYGSTPGELIDERSPCAPVTPYERAKHAVEQILEAEARGRYELVILRPTSVFGPGGRNLESLAVRVRAQSWPRRYLRACAMGRRRMHAVDVECVAAAALFLASMPLAKSTERFVVSQDDEPANDYRSIETFLASRLGATPFPVAPLALPVRGLRAALRLAGRTNVEPLRRYSAAKLFSAGFRSPRSFEAGLEEFAAWFASR